MGKKVNRYISAFGLVTIAVISAIGFTLFDLPLGYAFGVAVGVVFLIGWLSG